MDVLFLDTNVLFSAAYRKDAGLRRLWRLRNVQLLTSDYTLEEARRNLEGPEALERLEALVSGLRVVPSPMEVSLPANVRLPEKDWPVLGAAISAGATHLITGDLTHFGKLFGKAVSGVRILTPALYLGNKL